MSLKNTGRHVSLTPNEKMKAYIGEEWEGYRYTYSFESSAVLRLCLTTLGF